MQELAWEDFVLKIATLPYSGLTKNNPPPPPIGYQEYPPKWKLVKIVQDFGFEVTKNIPPSPNENLWKLVMTLDLRLLRIPPRKWNLMCRQLVCGD